MNEKVLNWIIAILIVLAVLSLTPLPEFLLMEFLR